MRVEDARQQAVICNICGSSVSSVLVSKDGHDVYQCAVCGLAFTHPRPPALNDQYDPAYFDLYRRRREFRLRRGEARLKRIELIKEPGRLLDVGCSLGYFVEAAKSRGWGASGIDISPHAAEESVKLGLDVRAGQLQDAGFQDGSFDCVTMWDVLEHVSDPTRHMLEVRRVLADGGLVVVGTPDIGHPAFRLKRERWRHLKPAEHIYYFTKPNLRRLLGKTGFRMISPPLIGARAFPGSFGAAVGAFLSRLAQMNDVMTIYGVRDELKVP